MDLRNFFVLNRRDLKKLFGFYMGYFFWRIDFGQVDEKLNFGFFFIKINYYDEILCYMYLVLGINFNFYIGEEDIYIFFNNYWKNYFMQKLG